MAPSSSSSDSHKYDVFLSFRGEDTRRNFVCHLHRALEQKAINTFIDSEKLEKGNKISELLHALEDSRVSIVVLSENYASSSWCLNELVKVLECMYTNNQKVVPIFYQVDPSHIRELNGKFGDAFTKKFDGADKQELESWRSALARIADLSGWDSSNYPDDIKLIEEVVQDTSKKCIHIARHSSPANDLVGIDSHIKEMSLLLCQGVNDVGVIGIWGMGGIGKTTLAKAVYGKIAYQFEHKCFLGDVKEGFAKKGEAQMRGEFLSEMLKDKGQSVGILNEGSIILMEGLCRKKVLVVLDDVDNFTQIEALLGDPYSFGVGSRIIITTRDKQSLSGVDELYEPKLLSHDKAHELFMKYAFRKNQPAGEYNQLSRHAIEYAQGLPLALKVLGASLYNKTEREWKGLLEKLKKIPHRGIMDVLKTSIEGLDDSEKDTFLDVACFFRGKEMYFVQEVLDSCDFFPDSALRILVERALITISHNNYIDMHDLLQEMGREIVRQESIKNPGGCSRLWRYEDVDRVLTQSTATEAVECIILDLSNYDMNICIDTGAFVRMKKLRLLMFYYSFYSKYHDFEYICPSESDICKQHERGDFDFLSHELRFLIWHGCPLKSLPSKFNPKNLARLDMRGSHIQQLWEGIMPLKKLKVILLSNCRYLVKTPDLTGMTNLERLVLDGCSSLKEAHPSISALQNLLILSLKGCGELKSLPSITDMKSLRTLNLSGCSNLEKFPEISKVMKELSELYLNETAIKELPSSVNNLTGIVILDLEGCKELESLPSSIDMKSLRTLNLSGCSNLEKFPEISEVMKELSVLYLNETAIKELPSSVNNLTGLVILDLEDCRELKSMPCSMHMKSLKTLDLSGCQNLEKFPKISEVMKELAELRLDETAIKELPSSINNLTGLVTLDLKGCRELKSLPCSMHMKFLKRLDLSGCQNLEKFPEISEVMKELSELYLNETAIKELPLSINNLTGLVILDLNGCRELRSLPRSMHMKSLKRLDLSGCHYLENFPEISEVMKEVSELCLNGTAIKELPSSIELLQGLESVSVRNCKSLIFLSDCICNLAHLTFLDLSGCSKLSCLPDNVGSLKSLRELAVQDSGIRQLPLSISRLREREIPLSTARAHSTFVLPHLSHVDLSNCNLIELSDAVILLSSLHTLNLSRNNFRRLPAALNQLQCLRVLNLEACRRLKSLPELSSSINDINAYDCTALETVSAPKPPYQGNICFTFFNCLQLVRTNLFWDIVENHHSHHQGNLRALDFRMCLPGCKIPDWFSHQCVGPSVTVQLPFENKILGFAICGHSNFKCPQYAADLSATCFCSFKGHDGNCSFSFYLRDWSAPVLQPNWSFKSRRFLRSDHIFMGYVPCPKSIIEEGNAEGGGRGKAGEEIRINYTEATFRIVLQSRGYTRGFRVPEQNHSITSCGVRLFYSNHEEEQVKNPSIRQTKSCHDVSHQDFVKPLIAVAKRSREVCCDDEAEPNEGIPKRRNLSESPF